MSGEEHPRIGDIVVVDDLGIDQNFNGIASIEWVFPTHSVVKIKIIVSFKVPMDWPAGNEYTIDNSRIRRLTPAELKKYAHVLMLR